MLHRSYLRVPLNGLAHVAAQPPVCRSKAPGPTISSRSDPPAPPRYSARAYFRKGCGARAFRREASAQTAACSPTRCRPGTGSSQCSQSLCLPPSAAVPVVAMTPMRSAATTVVRVYTRTRAVGEPQPRLGVAQEPLVLAPAVVGLLGLERSVVATEKPDFPARSHGRTARPHWVEGECAGKASSGLALTGSGLALARLGMGPSRDHGRATSAASYEDTPYRTRCRRRPRPRAMSTCRTTASDARERAEREKEREQRAKRATRAGLKRAGLEGEP